MLFFIPSPARDPAAARPAPRGEAAHARLHRAIEALLLCLLAALLPRQVRHDGAWHPLSLPSHNAPAPTTPDLRGPHDGTHLVCESPLLYVIGPGPNRGLRPRPRALPVPRPRIARAPPAPPCAPSVANPSPRGASTHALYPSEYLLN